MLLSTVFKLKLNFSLKIDPRLVLSKTQKKFIKHEESSQKPVTTLIKNLSKKLNNVIKTSDKIAKKIYPT